MRIPSTVALTLCLIAAPVLAQTPTVTKSNADAIKAEIKTRCRDSMGEYGSDMVLACMQQDWQAAKQIPTYQQGHPQITARCLNSMRDYGFDMVVACVQQDVSAQAQIDAW